MSLRSSTDILLPESAAENPLPTKVAAFVPIALAILGVSMILFGGLSARGDLTAAEPAGIDPIVTGSIVATPGDRHSALELLDR
jgi:hypothetical protein